MSWHPPRPSRRIHTQPAARPSPEALAMTPSRRTFLTTSAATVAASSALLPGAFAAGDETLKVGLVGCGGRGGGAAKNALLADPNVKLVAMCDAFMDRLETKLNELKGNRAIASKIDVPPERRFDGFDGV